MGINSRLKGAKGIDMSEEIWKPVRGYESTYMVSNYGNVKSLPRNTTKGKILKLYTNRRNGYVYVDLSQNNKQSLKRVHILVLEAFTDYVSRADRRIGIDHIDGDKTNNRLDNLEPVTGKENMRRAYENNQVPIVGVKCIDLDTKEIFNTYADAARSIGAKQSCKISLVCDGKRSHYRGHRFARLEDYENGNIPKYTGRMRKGVCKKLWV